MVRTRPSASDEMVTWSTAVSVPTTSIERRTAFFSTWPTFTGLAAASAPCAWAFCEFEQPAAASATSAAAESAAKKRREFGIVRTGSEAAVGLARLTSQYTSAPTVSPTALRRARASTSILVSRCLPASPDAGGPHAGDCNSMESGGTRRRGGDRRDGRGRYVGAGPRAAGAPGGAGAAAAADLPQRRRRRPG